MSAKAKDKRRSEKRSKSGKRVKTEKGGEKNNKDETSVRRDLITLLVEEAKENKEVIKYLTLFITLCFAFYIIYYFLTVSGSMVMARLRNITALILGAIFSLTGADVVVKGAMVSLNDFPLEIIDECTAVFSSIVYCSCVLAYPTTLKKKGLGIALGIPSLYAINILRLTILALVGISSPSMFEFVHVYLWQASFIIFVVVIFLIWLKLVVGER
ncbi:MAG: exosortase H [Methanophagales archaeon]|nr:exosortase H [Methanophagales archaeon]